MFFFVIMVWIWAGYRRQTTNSWRTKKPICDGPFWYNKCMTWDTWRFSRSSSWVNCDAFSLICDKSKPSCIRVFFVGVNCLLDIQSDGPLLADTYFGAFWACSLGGILEQFGWFGGMLEEFVALFAWRNSEGIWLSYLDALNLIWAIL